MKILLETNKTRLFEALVFRLTQATKNDPIVNSHNMIQLQPRGTDIDIQPIIGHNACLEYIAKYVSKAVVRDSFVSITAYSKCTDSTNKVLRKLLLKPVGERDFSAQEVMHHGLSLQLFSSSFQVVSVSLEGSRTLTFNDEEIDTNPRHYLITMQIDLLSKTVPVRLSNASFIATFFVVNSEIRKRPKAVVVRTYPNYYSNPI